MSSNNNTEIKSNNNENKITSEEDNKSLELLISKEGNNADVRSAPPAKTKEVEFSTTAKIIEKGINLFTNPKVYLTSLCAYVISVLATILFSLPLSYFAVQNNDTKTKSLGTCTKVVLKNSMELQNIIYILFEEVIFRFCIFKVIWMIGNKVGKKNNIIRITIIFTAFMISGFHFNFNNLMKQYIYIPGYVIPQLAYTAAYYYDNYFMAAVYTHLLNNFISPLFLLFFF